MWTYKYIKGIPLKLVQHKIELDTTIPPINHARYRLNPNHIITMKQDIDKLLITCFIHCGGGCLVVIDYGSAKRNWEAQNYMCGLHKVNFNNKEGSHYVIMNMLVSHNSLQIMYSMEWHNFTYF